jgi:hypothetical protein
MKLAIGVILGARLLLAQFATPVTVYPGSGSATGEIRLRERRSNGDNFTSLKASTSLAADLENTLPSAHPTTNGQCMTGTTAGVWSWAYCGAVLAVSDYDWSQSPGGSISIGSNTVTLTPCPLGVAGSAASLYVYLSGGTGTAETAVVTGGTCTGGASSGTVIFTAANTHSGAWTIASAAGGLREAILVGGNGATVVIPKNHTVTISQNVVIDKANISIQGGGWTSVVQARGSANVYSMFYVPSSSGAGLRMADFKIDGNRSGGGTSVLFGAGMTLGTNGTGGANHILVDRLEVTGVALFGIVVSDLNDDIAIRNSYIHDNGGGLGASDGGVGIAVIGTDPNAGSTNVVIANNYIANNYPTLTSATFGGGVFVGYRTSGVSIIGNQLLNNFNNGGQIASAGYGVISGNTVRRNSSKSGTDLTSGIEIVGASITVADNVIEGHGTGSGIVLEGDVLVIGGLGAADVTVTGNYVLTATDCIAIINAGGYVRGVTIANNRVAGCIAGLSVDTAAVQVNVTGNNFLDSTAAVTDNSTAKVVLSNNLPFDSNLIYGGTVASASAIPVRCNQTLKVSGTVTISYFDLAPTTLGPVGSGCTVTLIPSGLWATNTAGNIGQAYSATVNVPVTFVYDGATWREPEAVCTTCFHNGGDSFGAAATIGTNDANSFTIKTDNANRWTVNNSGMLYPATHDTYDIGLTGTRVRSIFARAGEFFVSGGTSSGDYLTTRKLNLMDNAGSSGAWDIQSVAIASPSSSSIYLRDNAGSRWITGTRAILGTAYNYTNVYTHLYPAKRATVDGDAVTDSVFPDLGSSSARWPNAYFGAVSVDGSITFATDNTWSIGSTFSRPTNTFTRALTASGTITFGSGSTFTASGTITFPTGAVNGYVWTSDASGNGSWAAGGSGSLPVADTTAIVQGSGDSSKQLKFEVDGFTTASTRTLTPQDASYTIAGTNIAQTFSGANTFSAGQTFNGTNSFNANQTFSGDIRFGADNTYNIGVTGTRPTHIFTRNFSMSASGYVQNGGTLNVQSGGTLDINSGGTLSANGSAGTSATKTVRASGGGSDCTLVFTNGILTGGTC